eukprot:m.351515 g.351515  ORF g.351515 m.351515 type:complete len:201 (+) comp16267_c0_seq1:401-1003(+)
MQHTTKSDIMAPTQPLLLRIKHRTPDFTQETATQMRRLSQQKLRSRRCSLHRALLIQCALPHLDQFTHLAQPQDQRQDQHALCLSSDFDDLDWSSAPSSGAQSDSMAVTKDDEDCAAAALIDLENAGAEDQVQDDANLSPPPSAGLRDRLQCAQKRMFLDDEAEEQCSTPTKASRSILNASPCIRRRGAVKHTATALECC